MDEIESFQQFIQEKVENRKKINILALVGSGLSASSGLYNSSSNSNNNNNNNIDIDTDNNLVWRNYSVIDLATPDAFDSNPALVWLFYAYRRHLALSANPNNGHKLLAKLSNLSNFVNFLTITQNMDGLHQRANHNSKKLLEFHGSLFDVKCTNFICTYKSTNYSDPLTPSLNVNNYLNPNDPLPKINSIDQLPLCPLCNSLLRPGVIWFGEALPLYLIDRADEFILQYNIDLLLIIGTSHSIWPTSSYIDLVKNQGGKIAVFNTIKDTELDDLNTITKVWQFIGDCAITLPEIFNSIIENWENENLNN